MRKSAHEGHVEIVEALRRHSEVDAAESMRRHIATLVAVLRAPRGTDAAQRRAERSSVPVDARPKAGHVDRNERNGFVFVENGPATCAPHSVGPRRGGGSTRLWDTKRLPFDVAEITTAIDPLFDGQILLRVNGAAPVLEDYTACRPLYLTMSYPAARGLHMERRYM